MKINGKQVSKKVFNTSTYMSTPTVYRVGTKKAEDKKDDKKNKKKDSKETTAQKSETTAAQKSTTAAQKSTTAKRSSAVKSQEAQEIKDENRKIIRICIAESCV